MKQYECSMSAKKESLIKAHEASDRRTIGEVETYEIIGVSKNGEPLEDYPTERYLSADELYSALDDICKGSTKGKLTVIKENPESAIEGYLDLGYEDGKDNWVFRVWFTLYFTDPVATALEELQLG